MKHFHLHKRYFTAIVLAFLLVQSLPAQFDEATGDPLLPWDQIVPQKIKTIKVMDCEYAKNDTTDNLYKLYEFDVQGKLLSITGFGREGVPTGGNHRFEYDSLGRIAFEFKEGLNSNRQPNFYYSFHYDENGLLKTRYRFTGPQKISAKPRDSVAHHYDKKQQLVRREYFSFRNIEPRIWELNFENGYGYDKKGRVIWRYGRMGEQNSPDTTFIQYDREGRISSENNYNLVPTDSFYRYIEMMNPDSIPETMHQDPKYFAPATQRTTHEWNGNTCEVTTRYEGINPSNPNYNFQHDIYIYDEQKKIVAAGKKTKSEFRTWTRYYYTYYP